MKRNKILWILIIIYLFPFIFSKADSLKTFITTIEFKVLYDKIYDDGIERIAYSPFYVVNENNEIILRSAIVLDQPLRFSLPCGNYYIYYKDKEGNWNKKFLPCNKNEMMRVE